MNERKEQSYKRRGLGRGLGALIPTTSGERSFVDRPVDVFFPGPGQALALVDGAAGADGNSYDDASALPAVVAGQDTGLVEVPGARFAEIPLDCISPNPRQPRTEFDEEALAELVHSITEIGVLQPVVVREVDPGEDGRPRYELVMGERRWRASQQAGTSTIPAIVRETGDEDLLRDALLENLHRTQLNPLEEAAAYNQLLEDFGCTHDELAARVGRSRPQISNTVRLLRLPAAVQRRVAAGVLSAGHARALLALADTDAMERLGARIVAEGLSVRSTEELVSLGAGTGPTTPRRRRAVPGGRQEALDDVANRLSERLDTRVRIVLGQRKGRVTVEFGSVDDLDRIVKVMSPEDPGVFPSS